MSATRTVSLWLSNTEGDRYACRGMAEEAWEEAEDASQVTSGVWTRSQAARFDLEERLSETYGEPEGIKLPGMYLDLLTHALGSVDWLEIADDFLSEMDFDEYEAQS